jgi:hypothetical protein
MYVFLRRSLEPSFLTTFRWSNPCGDGLPTGTLRVAGSDARAKMLVYPHAPRSNGTFEIKHFIKTHLALTRAHLPGA